MQAAAIKFVFALPSPIAEPVVPTVVVTSHQVLVEVKSAAAASKYFPAVLPTVAGVMNILPPSGPTSLIA